MGDENPIRTLGDYSKPNHEGYKNAFELLIGNNVVPLRSDTIRLVQNGCSFHGLWSEDPNQHLKDFLKLVDSLDLDGENKERTRLRLFQFCFCDQASNWHERLSARSVTTWEDLTTPSGKLRDRNSKESGALLKDLALYDNKSWNDPRNFAKPVKAITLPQDVLSTSDCCLIELKNQVQRLMEAYLALMQLTQVNKITTSCEEEPKAGEQEVVYFDILPIGSELAYHKKLDPRETSNGGDSNFTRKIKGMHVFVGNFTFVIDFMIVKDISSIIHPRLSQVVLEKPFVDISNITYDPPEGMVKFTNETDEIAYKLSHKIEKYNSLTDLEKEHTKSVYLKNEENMRRGVKYVMSKISGFYKECLEIRPEYVTGMDDKGEVM
nr:MAK10-like protein [Tanacetum cinerariifolium]